MNLLSVDNLSIEYVTPRGVVRAVDGISFEVPRSASCVLCSHGCTRAMLRCCWSGGGRA